MCSIRIIVTAIYYLPRDIGLFRRRLKDGIEYAQPLRPEFATCLAAKRPTTGDVVEIQHRIGRRYMDATTRGQLDQQHRITVEAIAYAEVIELARNGEAKEVEVMDGPARDVVELEQGICRALDRAHFTEPAQNTTRQGSLAGAVITHEIKYRRARRAGARKRGARGEHGLFAGDQSLFGGGLALCCCVCFCLL